MPDEPTIADILRSARRQQARAQTQQRSLGGRSIADIIAENQLRRTGQVDVAGAQRYADEISPEAQRREARSQAIQLGDPADIEVAQGLIRSVGGGIASLFNRGVEEVAERTRLSPERARRVGELRERMPQGYFQRGDEVLAQILFGD